MDKTIFYGKQLKYGKAKNSSAFKGLVGGDKDLGRALNYGNERSEVYKAMQGYSKDGKFTQMDARKMIGDFDRKIRSGGKTTINRYELMKLKKALGVTKAIYSSQQPTSNNSMNMGRGSSNQNMSKGLGGVTSSISLAKPSVAPKIGLGLRF